MEFKVTVESARRSLNPGDLRCINECCGSENITVSCIPGSSEELTKEVYVCRSCGTQWIAEMYAARVDTITPPDGDELDFSDSSVGIEPRVFQTIACPTGPIKDAIEEFLRAMKLDSPGIKGEALAKLAFLARVDL